uniref:Uncharacterized protein n=1 Tax=Rhizophora mucronata TaxID=61149 RepID=A0A2P2NKZ5_RHIMU
MTPFQSFLTKVITKLGSKLISCWKIF